MRINKFVAASTGLSRRAADRAIQAGRVTINGQPAALADAATNDDIVKLDGEQLQPPAIIQTVLFNKPAGYVVSRDGQGSKTIYDLLPNNLHHLKPIGRLDKSSSGLLLLTNDGELAHQLTHPSFRKVKIYETMLDKPLAPLHRQMINDHGIQLEDGRSQLQLERLRDGDDTQWRVTMHEGRNRQIRRTFAALGYEVTRLHRTQFGSYTLADVAEGVWRDI
jgi:23S rRNA pseudouridine2605 synthase